MFFVIFCHYLKIEQRKAANISLSLDDHDHVFQSAYATTVVVVAAVVVVVVLPEVRLFAIQC